MMNRLDFWLAVMVAASMASLRTGAARGPRDLMTSKTVKYLMKLLAPYPYPYLASTSLTAFS